MSEWPDQKRGEQNPRSLYTNRQVDQMRDRHELGGVSYRQLADEYGGSHEAVRKAVKRKSYPDT